MPQLQEWADASREWVDPLVVITVALALAILVVALLSRPPTTRDHRPPGGHYTGRVDFSNIAALLRARRKRRPKSRKEMAAAIQRGAAARRKLERQSDSDDAD